MASRIAVFASGAGSNLAALLSYLASAGETVPGTVSLVASDRPTAGALRIGANQGVAVHTVRNPQDGAELNAVLSDHQITLVVLAGYLKRVPEAVTRRFHARILNIHPALLPAFGGSGMYGRRVHEAVLAAGVRVTGATVHFVDEHYDHGPIVAQWPVPVRTGDTPDTLAARVLRVEHRLYPRAVAAVATGRVSLDAENRVQGDVAALSSHATFTLSTEETPLSCAP